MIKHCNNRNKTVYRNTTNVKTKQKNFNNIIN